MVGATLGLIEEISLKNFMCHSELTIDQLSKNKITFITGPNGSGKSAILTSLMLGFGGRANITCRGHSTKGFVKEGKPYAEIQLKLRNDTSFGTYQFENFGNFIYVRRRLTQSGHSEYMLLNERTNPIYKTAGALKKLMSFFDIRVDNPLMLLTQENAKKLLFDASEKDMYKFFRAGTGLDDIETRMTNIRKEIDRVRQNWVIRRDVHEKRKKDIEALKKRYNRYREVENFQQREVELTQALQWVDLAQKERELQNTRLEADRLAKQRTDVEKRKDEAHHCIEDMQTRIAEQAQAVQALADEVEGAKAEVQAAQARRSEALVDMKKVDAEVQFRQKKLQQLNGQKAEVMRAIEAAQRKLRAKQGADAEKQRSEAKLVDLRRQKAELESSVTEETTGREEAQRRLAECRQTEQRLRENEFALRRDLEQLSKQRASYENVQQNSTSRFGRQMPVILREIENAVRQGVFKRPPIGPLGRYVSLVGTIDETWAPAIEGAIGKHFSTFIVCCPADRQALHDILRNKVRLNPSNTQEYPTIIMSDRVGRSRVDISRTRASCPNSNLLSFFDLAEITDDDAFNFLLELSNIELKLFAEDAHATFDLVNSGRCINTFEVIGKNVDRVLYFQATKGSTFIPNRYPVRTNYLMKNVAQQMADVRQREVEANARYQEIRPRLEAAAREVGLADAAVRRIENAAAQINNRLRNIDSEIERLSRLAATVLEEPNDVTLLEEDLQRKQAEIEAFQTSQEQAVLDAKVRAANDQLKAADKQLAEARANQARKEQAHEQAEERSGLIQRSAADARRKLPAIREQFEKLTEQWNALRNRMDGQEASCKETLNTLLDQYGTRPRTRSNESRRDIEQQLKDLREKIADRERIDRTGFDSIPDRQKSVEVEQEDLEQRNLQLQSLEEIVQRRISGFPQLLNRTARHIEVWFSRMSYSKDLNSQLKFDHAQGTLAFRVSSIPAVNDAKRRMTSSGASQPSLSQTSVISSRSAQTPQPAATTRSIKTLSGGERSMSTVFFLLSLWEHSQSPVKGMDEFDVFLDGENREQAINLIVKFAPQMAGQFFLLSPCNVNSLGGPNARNQVIQLKKGGGFRGQESSQGSLSQGAVEGTTSRRRVSRARLTQSQSQSQADVSSTSAIAESANENREDEAEAEETVTVVRKRKRCKMEPTSEEDEEAAS